MPTETDPDNCGSPIAFGPGELEALKAEQSALCRATGSEVAPLVTQEDLDAATEWICNRPHNVSRQIDSLALLLAKHRATAALPNVKAQTRAEDGP
jgi:hypothetical protein